MTREISVMVLFCLIAVNQAAAAAVKQDGVVSADFIFEEAAFASCHASTIAQTPGGFVAAWFGGTREGAADVEIWGSTQAEGKWSAPRRLADGVQPDGSRFPCWNPVLFQVKEGPLLLFYKMGPSPAKWWGLLKRSNDGGATWSEPARLPEGMLGPIKNKPVRLEDGAILCPSSDESFKAAPHWRIHFERTADLGKTWERVEVAGGEIDAIQPSILFHPDRVLQAVGRTRSGRVFETWSKDAGRSWSPPTLTPLTNPNAGTDAVTLRDGRQLIVYNHNVLPGLRTPLNVAISTDGRSWEAAAVLESDIGEYSYPAVIQAEDGKVHIVYTWKRKRIKHVIIDPAALKSRPMVDGKWPQE